MNTCSICYQPFTHDVDRMLYEGIPVAEIARTTGQSRQAIGRHKRALHAIKRGGQPDPKAAPVEQPALGDDLDDETYQGVYDAAAALAFALHGIPPAVLAAHAQDTGDDSCPACKVESGPAFDRLVDGALAYRRAAVGAGQPTAAQNDPRGLRTAGAAETAVPAG